MPNFKLDPHVINRVLIAIQAVALLSVFIAGYKAMHLTGSQQVAKAIVSYMAFVVFLVIDIYRKNRLPWIR